MRGSNHDRNRNLMMAACEDDSEVLALMGMGDVSSCLNLARSDKSDFVTSNLQGVSLHNFEIGQWQHVILYYASLST